MVEAFYTGLLVVALLAAAWVAIVVVSRLFKGQG